jgi:hypothetical protein
MTAGSRPTATAMTWRATHARPAVTGRPSSRPISPPASGSVAGRGSSRQDRPNGASRPMGPSPNTSGRAGIGFLPRLTGTRWGGRMGDRERSNLREAPPFVVDLDGPLITRGLLRECLSRLRRVGPPAARVPPARPRSIQRQGHPPGRDCARAITLSPAGPRVLTSGARPGTLAHPGHGGAASERRGSGTAPGAL